MTQNTTPRAVAQRYLATDMTPQANSLLRKAGVHLQTVTKLSEQLLDGLERAQTKVQEAERRDGLYKVASVAAKSGHINPLDIVEWVNLKMSEAHPPEYYAQVFRASRAQQSAFTR